MRETSDVLGMAVKVPIPEFIPHVDCPSCAVGHLTDIAVYGKPTRADCWKCKGEGVLRKDGRPTLKTKVRE